MRDAELFKQKIERIVSSQIAGNFIDDDTNRWIAGLAEPMTKKLASVGLVKHAGSASMNGFISAFIDKRKDVKPNTSRFWLQTLEHLNTFFGESESLKSISKGMAKDWRLSLIGKELSEATVRKHCGFAKFFFNEAIDRELVQSNPFAGLPSSPIANPKRQQFITHEEIGKVIEACPDIEWKLIVALARFGGLRTPSETFLLRWEDINWEKERFIVHSPKTERHQGHESRVVPSFPELLPFLRDAFEAAEDGAEFCIAKHRHLGSNIRTQMGRIIKRSGLTKWPRVFHNLRASRQTELEADHPTHVVCSWIGNSPQVAGKHYLQVREEDFEKAIIPKRGQNAAHHSVDSSETRWKSPKSDSEENPINKDESTSFHTTAKSKTGVDGNRIHLATFQPPHWV